MHGYWIRIVSIILVVGVLLEYNNVLTSRAQQEEIARLETAVTNEKNMVIAYQTAYETKEEETDDNAGIYTDGTYEGEADGFGGVIKVQITIKDQKLTNIEILEAEGEDGTYLSMAEALIPVMLQQQNAQADTISGATFSSTGIINATQTALEKAVS